MADELIVARTVSQVSEWGIGRDLGEPVLHDDGSEPGMVDIMFPNTFPEAAMEVTSIVDEEFPATANAAQKAVEQTLRGVAEESGHKVHWTFHIASGTSVKRLEGLMTDIITGGSAPAGRSIAPGLNKVDAEQSDTPDVTIATWSSFRAVPTEGFRGELSKAIADKRAKLEAAEGYERHLAVDVLSLRASDPGLTPCPPLPDEIDFIWVTRRAYSASRGSPVVWVSDGTGAWKTNGKPHEAM